MVDRHKFTTELGSSCLETEKISTNVVFLSFYLLTHERVLRDAVAEEDVETIDHPAHLGGGGQGLVNEGEGELVKHRGLAPGLLLLQRAVGGQPVGPGPPHAAADQRHEDEQQQEAEAGGGDDDESLPGEAGGHPRPRHQGRGGGPPHQLAAGQDLPLVTVGPRHLHTPSCQQCDNTRASNEGSQRFHNQDTMLNRR